MENKDLSFRWFIDNKTSIQIPSYQRAYAWEEKQIEDFINDLVEIGKKEYYYGHFIVETYKDSNVYEIIDGQQRITTFVLFLLSSNLFLDFKLEEKYIEFIKERFNTVDYDRDSFKCLVNEILNNKTLPEKKGGETASFNRILKTLEYLGVIFGKNKTINISEMINTLLNAKISVHEAHDKKVAVQVFELQNSRGLKLDLIEKVKSLLMKEIYLYSNQDTDAIIIEIQKKFSEIYRLEEKTADNSFRGQLKLDNILFHHLKVIDDGSKLKVEDFYQPADWGNMEDNIMNYLKEKIKNVEDKKAYILNVCERFSKSVKFICDDLIVKDQKNALVGDCVILERNHSIEMYLILLHHDLFCHIDLKKWEKLLFTNDFHSKYYRKRYRDNFPWLYNRIIANDNQKESENQINNILDDFIKLGFRRDLFNDSLQEIFSTYIQEHKNNIIRDAYNFWYEKMIYLLYKYEIESIENTQNKGSIRNAIREYFKKGKSVEHILPQNYTHLLSDKNKENDDLKKSIDQNINGIGNLLIISPSENSSQSDHHPKDKRYTITLGSYSEQDKWEDEDKWIEIINDRGKKIYRFLEQYFIEEKV